MEALRFAGWAWADAALKASQYEFEGLAFDMHVGTATKMGAGRTLQDFIHQSFGFRFLDQAHKSLKPV